MRKRFLTILTAAFIAGGMAFSLSTARAQETKEKQSKDVTAEKQSKPPTFYRVDYSISELDHGKRANTRNYTLKVEGDRGNAGFRVGSRIPLSSGTPAFQYYDVGVNLDCGLREYETFVWLHTKLELNSVAGSESSNVATPPVIRHLQFNDTISASLGKAILVGAIDDVTANRRYEIEVTVEKIK